MGAHKIKKVWLAAAFLSGVAFAMFAEELILRANEDRLEFSAPNVHFLTGRPLERLKSGAEIPYDFQVTLWSGTRANAVRRGESRFIISYDLWEESYSVTKFKVDRTTRHNLTAAEAEAWCLQQMAVNLRGLRDQDPLWVRMEIRAGDEDGRSRLLDPDHLTEGINLNFLIEAFSRPARPSQQSWVLEAGPISLAQIRRGG